MDRHNPLRRLAAPNGMSGEDLVHKKERTTVLPVGRQRSSPMTGKGKELQGPEIGNSPMTRPLPLISFNTVFRSIAMSSDLCKHNYELI